MDIQLEAKRALVIVGKQGSGKTRLALSVAEKAGSYTEASINQLFGSAFELGALLSGEPSTLIVDGFAANKEELSKLKGLICSDTLMVDKKYSAQKLVKTPNFIFCCAPEDVSELDSESRRFNVVTISI